MGSEGETPGDPIFAGSAGDSRSGHETPGHQKTAPQAAPGSAVAGGALQDLRVPGALGGVRPVRPEPADALAPGTGRGGRVGGVGSVSDQPGVSF